MRHTQFTNDDCSIAKALDIVGDGWTLLVVRDVARGITRFSDLAVELGVSRKILTERLTLLVEHGVLERRQYYLDRPPRFEYHLAESGRGLLPVLIALQSWGSRYVTGNGTLTATSEPGSAESQRVHGLVGSVIPKLLLTAQDGSRVDPVTDMKWSLVFCFPGSPSVEPGLAPGWESVSGGTGCTSESRAFRDRMAEFEAVGAAVVGVCTQNPMQLGAFAEREGLPFPLLSDQELLLCSALRLPTFRAAGIDRLKRLTLVVDRTRTVRGVLYPVPDPAGSAEETLRLLGRM